ncbi:MAG TPA: hypothetical protein VIH90_05980 [Candidatus Saccharimonadales bacterium]
MDSSAIDDLNSFTLDNIPNLDVAVIGALELFSGTSLPKIDINAYQKPLIVGSGNAEATGRIMFRNNDAVFASESDYQSKLENISSIDGVVIISASGGKHAPLIARNATQLGKHVTLITNTENSLASKELDHQHEYDEYVFPKNREPYTYNTSTYMAMILGATHEDPKYIKDFIDKVSSQLNFPDFSRYNKYYLIVPAKFTGIIRMLQVKFIELFGRNIARDIETSEYVRHATTVAPSDELFISFGEENTTWGELSNRLFVPLPEGADYGAMMAVGYYLVSQIQSVYPHYFKDNIGQYTEQVSKIFGEEIKPIVG